MTLRELKLYAKTKGLKILNMKRENIIRAIQSLEGNTPCFGTSKVKNCDQKNCLWLQECLYYYNRLNLADNEQ
ncbi:MAG: SAP domain-containing protein [Nitrospirae bacterium]|nr:SAP domain-containing protein [Nitrospirota bacterium]